jgi:hypothetical protein
LLQEHFLCLFNLMSLTDESAVAEMLSRYGFDLGGQTAANLVRAWSRQYDPTWLLPAVIETLDRGRYKAASVEQVLAGWRRRGAANPRFSSEFAAMVLSKIDASPTLLDEGDLNESLLDAAITSFAEPTIEDPVAPVFDLSDPALDEENVGLPEALASRNENRFTAALSAVQMTASLIPSNYPPLPLRKPADRWEMAEADRDEADAAAEDQCLPPLTETFTPPAQVSQFYYRLLAMAATAPAPGNETSAVLTRSPMVAEG